MPDGANVILQKMLERLFASLVGGPGMNCRPHSSRQRVDVAQLGRLGDASPEVVLKKLLGEERHVKLTGRVARPKRELKKTKGPAATPEAVSAGGEGKDPAPTAPDMTEEEKRLVRQWSEQQTLISKLRTIAEDARTYEQDTGVHVLNIGFPLLSLPPGSGGKGRGGGGFLSRRIVAPIAFIPVVLEVKAGASVSVEIACKGEGVDLVHPNIALLAWLEQQTGKKTPELFDDREAENPWREILELVQHVATAMKLQVPEALRDNEGLGETFALAAAPRADDEDHAGEIVLSAVLGLYPMANEGLLRDMQAMAAETGTLDGPLKSFLEVNVDLNTTPEEASAEETPGKKPRVFAEERLVAQADPCQARAALLARKAAGLVIHGPPGTGKSQTITNIIGDHLARGQRVLMVCDKRTALDVVAHRLEHLGFGPLIAIVHDPQRDQRDLYKAIRERLENLSEVRTRAGAAREVERMDAELQQLHNDLSAYWKSLMQTGERELSFHDAMGEWLAIDDAKTNGTRVNDGMLADVSLQEGRTQERHVRELLERGITAQYPRNPWVWAATIRLADYLAKPIEPCREKLRLAVDATVEMLPPSDPAIQNIQMKVLEQEAAQRRNVAEQLKQVLASCPPDVLARLAKCDQVRLNWLKSKFAEIKPSIDKVSRTASVGLDTELLARMGNDLPAAGTITVRLLQLERYLKIAGTWFSPFAFGAKRAGREVLQPLGLQLNRENGERAETFLTALRARLAVRDVLVIEETQKPMTYLPVDADLLAMAESYSRAVSVLLESSEFPGGAALGQRVRQAFAEPAAAGLIIEEIQKSAAHCAALLKAEAALTASGLTTSDNFRMAIVEFKVDPKPYLRQLADTLPQLENVLRIYEGMLALPEQLRPALTALLKQGAAASEGWASFEKALLAAEISRRLRDDSWLQAMDGQRLKTTFERYRELDQKKRQLVREAVLHHWVTRQKERLLASTQSRASTLGADLRRRLTMRGERALRLRQVIEVGSNIEGGDPLFDMSPVWMASPETVAQIFPRLPLFDVVIFDEASQCRLEEALPVLTRGKRVVIAGDPKQLPPTRFFESAITVSEDDDADDQQSLFERQQGEVEDLLTAALNLSIENAYLDVHYRSRNSDLIRFSNEQFYHHRLQAIPGHPANSTTFCPLTLYRADGTYEDRANEKEAEQVCRIVRDLLKRAQPPSIGIACFNMVQRDLILEKLDALAMEDPEFSRRLGEARNRRGAGSFEGLFVKNLENVQGDERDHIIISTTYGPTKEGRFYQRFGPLGRAGGGRRLNVLITRAREEVHLVTSIPAEIYRNLPPVPEGQTPGGGWLLFSYLQFAERLAGAYAEAQKLRETATIPPADDEPPENEAQSDPINSGSISPELLPVPAVFVRPQVRSLPSRFSESVAQRLAGGHGMGSVVHWGNDGFCVDVALAHPLRPDDVTIGILCDGARFQNADDPVEWDLFRTQVHESQGWKLHRVWTPQFFRQPADHLDAIAAEAREHIANEKPPDALGVVRTDG